MTTKTNDFFHNLIIFEMANNHMGDPAHGRAIIDAFAVFLREFPQFRFAFKFQFRDLTTFIHRDYQERTDLKYIKRFKETALTQEQFAGLKTYAASLGFLTACTPFDEVSVDRIVQHDFDILKIASCSFSDWPLLEKAAGAGKPLVLSTAGVLQEDLDKVVSFLRHRELDFALMHCVGSYPTPPAELEMNQIDYFKQRYPDVPVGFSTHESPEELVPVMIACAKGAAILERHVGLETEQYKLNAYSSTPDQIREWLNAALKSRTLCGIPEGRRSISEKEAADLRGLQRGMFLKRDLPSGHRIVPSDVFFAIPCMEGQVRANDFSKYLELTTEKALSANTPVFYADVAVNHTREIILGFVRKVADILIQSKIPLTSHMDLELSHHYGLEKFDSVGCTIITCVNREYCKKIIVVLPGQKNPAHSHRKKEETFHILYGELELTLDGVKKVCHAGELVVVERGVLHDFGSCGGAVLEEISTTHYPNDSYYDDSAIASPERRKTYMTFFPEWLKNNGGDIR